MASQIFISYRRSDTEKFATKVFESLLVKLNYDEEDIFFDLDSIRGGQYWDSRIREEVENCRIFIAIIGNDWRKRLFEPDDYVRLEVETALSRERFVIPVLVDDTPLPQAEDLPEGMRSLLKHQFRRINTTENFSELIHDIVNWRNQNLFAEIELVRMKTNPLFDRFFCGDVYVDGKWHTTIQPGTIKRIYLSPGRHRIKVGHQTLGSFQKEYHFSREFEREFEADKVYRYRCGIAFLRHLPISVILHGQTKSGGLYLKYKGATKKREFIEN